MPRTKPAPELQPPTPRSRKGAATRARLLEAAKHVFEDAGFLEARISDIAERAGLSHGSFYHYFDSKEQVFREVAEAQEALLTAPGDDDSPDGDGGSGGGGDAAPTEFDRILRANRRYLRRYRDNGKIMGVIEEVSRYDAFVNEARMRRQKHFADRAEAAVRRLQAEGAADPDIDPEIAAVALGSMVARFAELWLLEDWAPYDFDRAAEQVSRLWANAIGLRKPARRSRRKA
ncbi:MAG TPA: helix-turn-helix domain-containing protein [Acidimicrobiales bacterium]|nr:helix-turn-helix domain-containing protein [Acidimicrobiales bacterium]